MNDLISRKYILDALGIFNDRENGNEHFINGIETAKEIVTNQDSVEAVPLEPLCVWLAGYAVPPQYALNEVLGDKIDPESIVYTVNTRVEAWKYHFRELLKSGLMDTEESNDG